ncbi:hybrid sensor histidine kinase/response regulator [Bacteroides caccae]|uniref:histidine kinase n=2 Tax=Bacteroides caccae TaxID=47678 RepID=A0A414YFL6_9BACE|nr:hybrid sensor histidine kinase/response regulator [Bacteroides caccae]
MYIWTKFIFVMNMIRNNFFHSAFIFLISAFILCNKSVFAIDTNFKFKHMDISTGLNSNTVYCTFQDSNGQMWFGTNDGLTTYDTYTFKTWRTDSNNPYSIGNNGIYCIYEDRDKQLWIGTEKGLYLFNRISDKFQQIIGLNIENSHIRSIAEDSHGQIWAASLGHGIFKYNPKNEELRNYRQSQGIGLNSDYSTKILSDSLGNIWCLASGSYLHRYNQKSDTFEKILIKDKKNRTVETNVFTMCLDWKGDIWIAGWDCGIFHYSIKESSFKNYLMDKGQPILQGRIHTIKAFGPNNIYIGSDQGLTLFNPSTQKHITTSYNRNNSSSLSDDFVYDILKDNEGGLWITTYFGGINYSNPNSSNFTIRHCTNESEKGRIISKFHEDKNGYIFIGTDDGGLFIYNPAKDECQRYTIDKSNPNLNIHAIWSSDTYLWVGTYSKGLYRINHQTKDVEHIPYFEKGNTTNESIYSIHEDLSGRIWIGTKTTIWTWTKSDGFIKEKELGYNSDIIAICEDLKGNIWFASLNRGILNYSPTTHNITHIYKSSNGMKIPNEIISMSLHTDYLFIGTSGQGLLKYHIPTESITKARCSNIEMEHLSIYNITSYKDNLWLSTNEGLLCYNPSTTKCNIFGKYDGLNTDLFNPNSGIVASDGKIYLGSNNGFSIVTPDRLKNNTVKPNTIFIHTSNTLHKQTGNTILYKWHNPFTIEFASLSYHSPINNKYKYYLEGYHSNWIETDWKNNRVTFSDLPCGKYTFWVRSSNNDGVWGAPVSWDIIIKPHWWNSTVAIVIYILICMALVFGIITYSIMHHIQKKKNRITKIKHIREKTRIETELQFFFSLAQEIQTPIMLINNPANEIANSENLPENIVQKISIIQNSAKKLSNLADEILDLKKINTEVNLYPAPIIDLTRQIVNTFKANNSCPDVDIVFIDDIKENVVTNLNTDAWSKIMNHLLSNALRFTNNLIEVRAKISNNRIVITVHDNGIGISQDDIKNVFNAFWHYEKTNRVNNASGFGLGLAVSRLLLYKMDMTVNIESEVNKFTTFSISTPICEKRLANETILERTQDLNSSDIPSVENINQSEIDSYLRKHNRILIVDNDRDLQLYLAGALSKDYKILTATNGEEAMETLSIEEKPDIIICEVMIPKMNGINLCKRLKKDVNLYNIPIIMFANNTDINTKMYCIQNGAEAFIEKPINIDYLKIRIKNILEKRRLLQNFFSKHPFITLSEYSDNNVDDCFLKQFSDIVTLCISKHDLTVDDIAKEMCMSRSVLFKRVKEITEMTPNNYIKAIRLRKAAELLVQDEYKINEICYLVGFNNHSYFTKCFVDYFGLLPKEYIVKKKKEAQGV